MVHQGQLELGVDDALHLVGGIGGGVALEEQRDEAGVLLAGPVEVAADPPGVASRHEGAGLQVAAVYSLEPRVALDPERMAPGADHRGGDGGHGGLLLG